MKSITAIVSRLHARLGDFWWYSILMFVALRIGDVINAFVGLWLVPKYVDASELGAVLPLTQFATFLALPLSLLITVFTKFLNKYKTLGELGKVKSLLRSFIGFTLISVVLSLLLSTWLMPHMFERIKVTKGSLGILVIASGLLGTAAPVFTTALQGLKKFKTITFINLFCAPIRLATMLIAMPIRALSGYMVGQTAAPAFAIIASWLSLRKDTANQIESVPFWREDWKPITRYFIWVVISAIPGQISGFAQTLIIRQRLSVDESAAFYIISRFAELATYAGATLLFVMFPIAAESHVKGRENRRVLFQMNMGTIVFGFLCTVFLWAFGENILSIIPATRPYSSYATDMAILAAALVLQFLWGNYSSFETANNRFSYVWYNIPITIAYAAILICFTGATYFDGTLPNEIIRWMQSCKVNSLRTILFLLLFTNGLKLFFAAAECFIRSLRRSATASA